MESAPGLAPGTSPSAGEEHETCVRTAGHCLHRREHRVGPPRHRDLFCCWCGFRRCNEQNLLWPGMSEHGPFVAGGSHKYFHRKPDVVGYDSLKIRDKVIQNDDKLTKVLLRILRQVSQGKTNDEIAQLFGIQKRTAMKYRQEIMKRLKSKNMFEAVAKGVRKGYI